MRLTELRNALRTCYPGPAIIAGYAEPSALFLMGHDGVVAAGSQVPGELDRLPRALAIVESSHARRFEEALAKHNGEAPVRLACASGRNPFTANRTQVFEVYVKPPISNDPACIPPPRYRCPE